MLRESPALSQPPSSLPPSKGRKATGGSILLGEQNARAVLQVSDYGYVLETGRIILSDTSAALRQNPQVKHAYLGGT